MNASNINLARLRAAYNSLMLEEHPVSFDKICAVLEVVGEIVSNEKNHDTDNGKAQLS